MKGHNEEEIAQTTTTTTTSTTPQPANERPNERPVEEPRTHEIVPDLNVYQHHMYPHIMQSGDKGKFMIKIPFKWIERL